MRWRHDLAPLPASLVYFRAQTARRVRRVKTNVTRRNKTRARAHRKNVARRRKQQGGGGSEGSQKIELTNLHRPTGSATATAAAVAVGVDVSAVAVAVAAKTPNEQGGEGHKLQAVSARCERTSRAVPIAHLVRGHVVAGIAAGAFAAGGQVKRLNSPASEPRGQGESRGQGDTATPPPTVRVVRPAEENTGCEWYETVDPATGLPYYVNSDTHAVTWDRPQWPARVISDPLVGSGGASQQGVATPLLFSEGSMAAGAGELYSEEADDDACSVSTTFSDSAASMAAGAGELYSEEEDDDSCSVSTTFSDSAAELSSADGDNEDEGCRTRATPPPNSNGGGGVKNPLVRL
jgi:hypothetical protein